MGQVLQGCARTTKAVRGAIQHSQESLRALTQRYGVNPKTVAQVEKALLGGRSADQAEAGRINCSFSRRGSLCSGFSPAHAAAA